MCNLKENHILKFFILVLYREKRKRMVSCSILFIFIIILKLAMFYPYFKKPVKITSTCSSKTIIYLLLFLKIVSQEQWSNSVTIF